MAKRALLIGINYVGTENALGGCVNDILSMKDVLVEILGFDEENITLLYDEGNEQGPETFPTAINIKNALEAVVSETEDGDVLFIQYSGHGTQVPDQSGEEQDGKDECLVSGDMQLFTDDWLKSLFAQLPPGAFFTFVADCCHSGTLLDQPPQDLEISGEKDEDEAAEYEESGVEPANRNLDWEVVMGAIQEHYGDVNTFMAANPFVADELADEVDDPEDPNSWAYKALSAGRSEERPDTSGLSNAVLITGCEDNQTSSDFDFSLGEGQNNGALSWALISVLRESEQVPTYRELVAKARAKIAAYPHCPFEQNPCLMCADELADAPFICDPSA